MLQLLLLVSSICLPNVFGAVLTSTLNVYYPFDHDNHRPAIENGQLSYIGEENGVTTYLFTEPQTPGVTATFIEGDNVAVIIAVNNPSFLASYSCDVQVTQAVCLLVNMDTQNGAGITVMTTDTPIDSIALLVVGLPGETAQATPSTPAPPSSTASPTSSPTPPANQNPPPSTPKGSPPTSPSPTSSQHSSASQSSSSSSQSSGPPTAVSGKETSSQSASLPSSEQGSDQNLLPGSGSAKTSPTITLGISILLNLVLLYVSALQ